MDWAKLRDEFPVTRQWAFLDHAGVSAASAPAVRVLSEYSLDISENGAPRVGFWSGRSTEVRALIADMIHADARGLAFVKNTTEALDFVAEGLNWQAGDNLVLPADEYPSNQYPWINLQSRGVEIRRIPPRGNRIELTDLEAAIDSRTRLVAASWVGYASGFRIDLADFGEMCRRHNILSCVDAIQGLGALPLNLEATPVDFIACGSHKWLLGFQGAGFLYLRPELLPTMRPQGIGAHSVVDKFNYPHIEFRLRPDATRYEGGALNLGGIAAWGASLKLLRDLGVDAVAGRIRELTGYLCERANSAGLTIYSDRSADSGIVSLETPGRDALELNKRLKAEGVAVNCREGRIRVSPHCYNNYGDLDRFLEAIRK